MLWIRSWDQGRYSPHAIDVDEHESDEEDQGVLLIDAKNAFNEGNRKMMLWVVRHKWPSGARFMFNIYRHQSVLVVRGESKKKTLFFIVVKD